MFTLLGSDIAIIGIPGRFTGRPFVAIVGNCTISDLTKPGGVAIREIGPLAAEVVIQAFPCRLTAPGTAVPAATCGWM